MALASGANVGISYVEETTAGTTPGSPSMKELRLTSKAINPSKNILRTNERRSDRMIADSRHGFLQVGGSPGFELSREAYDDMLEAALSGTWAAGSDTGATSLNVDSATEFGRSAGSFLTDGFEVGDYVTSSGFTNADNNGDFLVTAVAATTLTVDGALIAETGDGDEQIQATGKKLKIGTTLRTFTFERRFTDLTKYQVFRGVAVNSMSLNIQPEQIVGGNLGLLGMSAAALSGSSLGSPASAATNSPFSAFDGTLWEADSQIAIVTGLSLDLQNNRTVNPVVGSNTSPDVFEGDAVITGTLTAFFEDETLLNKFINETESSLHVRLDDLNGSDWINIRLPRVKFNGGEMDPPQSGPVPLSLPFEAIRDSDTSTSMMIQRSNT